MNKINTGLNQSRVNYIDWLRVSAVLLLFVFHTDSVFSHMYFYYLKNSEGSVLAAFINGFIHQWHMPLFMFLSGMSSYYALRFRSGTKFMQERLKRLLIPLILGTFLLVPPLSYIRTKGDPTLTWPEGLSHLSPGPDAYPSFLSFLPDFYTQGIFPFGYLEWSHLWFLAYLLTFSLLAIRLFLFLNTKKGGDIIDKIVGIASKPFGIFLFIIPIALSEVCLRWKYPGLQNLVSDWANFVTYFTVFIFGFLMVSHQAFQKSIDKHWKQALSVGVLLNIFMISLYVMGIAAGPGDAALYIISMIGRAVVMWSILIGLTGLGKQYLNNRGRILAYAAEAALPYYILHQILIVVLGYQVIGFSLPSIVKYFTLLFASFACTAIIYELFVRRFNLIRFCFGLKKN